jgi:hypothetical protein
VPPLSSPTDTLKAISTLIVCIYLLVAEYNAPVAYNYWAILGLDIFLVIFWLCSFAVQSASISYSVGYYGYTYDYYYDSYYADGYSLAWYACQAAAAGLGGVQL